MPFPGFLQNFSVWMEDRQKDLQEALSTGDHSRAVTLSLMLTKGAERMVEMTRQDISDDEFRSRAASGEGRFAPIDGRAHIKMFRQVWSEGGQGWRSFAPRTRVSDSRGFHDACDVRS